MSQNASTNTSLPPEIALVFAAEKEALLIQLVLGTFLDARCLGVVFVSFVNWFR